MSRPGVNVVAISSNDVVNYPQDDVPLMKDLAEDHGFTFPYLYDPTQDVARGFTCGVRHFQRVRRQSHLRLPRQFDGARPSNDMPVTGEDLRRVVDLLVEGKPVPAEGQMPSIGCNIRVALRRSSAALHPQA